MPQRELNQRMMDTAIRIGQIEPTHCQRLVLLLSLLEDRTELELMLSAARHIRQKCLLKRWIEVVIAKHELEPTIAREGGEDLTNTGCEGNGPEIGRICGIICSRTLCQ